MEDVTSSISWHVQAPALWPSHLSCSVSCFFASGLRSASSFNTEVLPSCTYSLGCHCSFLNDAATNKQNTQPAGQPASQPAKQTDRHIEGQTNRQTNNNKSNKQKNNQTNNDQTTEQTKQPTVSHYVSSSSM